MDASGTVLLDENGEAAYVAAAIPDKFSETGQVWGNPLYNWPLMQEDGFSWWKRRMQISTKLFDVIRMDHFIGFVKIIWFRKMPRMLQADGG